MHDPNAEGNDFFKCDFCRRGWSEQRPMVEGHQGSLICAPCLSVAFAELILQKQATAPEGYSCTMCLEERSDPGWMSPAHDEARICTRCVRQSATKLEKDPDSEWTKPRRD